MDLTKTTKTNHPYLPLQNGLLPVRKDSQCLPQTTDTTMNSPIPECVNCYDPAVGTYGPDNESMCACCRDMEGFCSCGGLLKECENCWKPCDGSAWCDQCATVEIGDGRVMCQDHSEMPEFGCTRCGHLFRCGDGEECPFCGYCPRLDTETD